MDNFDFVAHLANTSTALGDSVKVVENYVRSYYQEMHAVTVKWSGFASRDNLLDQAFSELNAVHHRYWLPKTRFTEYWQPAIEPPDAYVIVDPGITTFSDMLGNFVATVRTTEGISVFLLSVVCDELKIVNKFFA
jgi:hypothetical protein